MYFENPKFEDLIAPYKYYNFSNKIPNGVDPQTFFSIRNIGNTSFAGLNFSYSASLDFCLFQDDPNWVVLGQLTNDIFVLYYKEKIYISKRNEVLECLECSWAQMLFLFRYTELFEHELVTDWIHYKGDIKTWRNVIKLKYDAFKKVVKLQSGSLEVYKKWHNLPGLEKTLHRSAFWEQFWNRGLSDQISIGLVTNGFNWVEMAPKIFELFYQPNMPDLQFANSVPEKWREYIKNAGLMGIDSFCQKLYVANPIKCIDENRILIGYSEIISSPIYLDMNTGEIKSEDSVINSSLKQAMQMLAFVHLYSNCEYSYVTKQPISFELVNQFYKAILTMKNAFHKIDSYAFAPSMPWGERLTISAMEYASYLDDNLNGQTPFFKDPSILDFTYRPQ